jgi:C4-dicarboxylate-specific signal transduction histidine kinase
MSWHSDGRTAPAYYQHVRQGDRVRRVYIGRGPEAHRLAREVEQRRQDMVASREAFQRELAEEAAAEQSLQELRDMTDLLVEAVLLTANCYHHHGQWRRRGHGRESQSARRN